MKPLLGVALVVIASVCYGFLALFNHWALTAPAGFVGTEMLLCLRFGLAGVVLGVIVLILRIPMPPAKDALALIGLGGVCYVGQSLCYFKALDAIPAGLTALLLYLYPAIVTVASRFLFHERLTPTRLGAVVVAMLGTLLASPFLSAASGESGAVRSLPAWLGVVLGVAMAFIYAVYILGGSRVTPRAGPLQSAFLVTLSAGAVYAVLALVRGQHLPTDARTWTAAASLTLIGTIIPIAAIFAGFRFLSAVQVSTLSTFEPLTAVLVGYAFLHEGLTWVQIVGGAMILVSAVVIARSSPPPPSPQPTPGAAPPRAPAPPEGSSPHP